MVVGFIKFSLSESTGISTGMPPACRTPFFTFSASTLKCRWQGLISDQVFRMAITGLPCQSSGPSPSCRARERWPKERRSFGPNQRNERSSSGARGVDAEAEASMEQGAWSREQRLQEDESKAKEPKWAQHSTDCEPYRKASASMLRPRK